MRIILHIGMPKCGSSALQAGLRSARHRLREAGILYPDGDRGSRTHQFLVYGSVPPERLPRQTLQAYGGNLEAIARDAQRWMAALERQVDATDPHTLILSEESLFKISGEDGLRSLSERLRRLGDTVAAVAYVRRPSDYYLSAVQQTLKASHRIAPPGRVLYRQTIEGYARQVADEMIVHSYDPAAWPDHDIVRHFLTQSLPAGGAIATAGSQQVNTSLSAEAMVLLQGYRRQVWPDDDNRFTSDTNTLLDALVAADRTVGGDLRPRLHDHVRRAIDHQSTDLVWLRDHYGVCFDGIDYEDIHPSADRPPTVEEIARICRVDDDRLSELTFTLLQHLTGRGHQRKLTTRTPSRREGTRQHASNTDTGSHRRRWLPDGVSKVLRAILNAGSKGSGDQSRIRPVVDG